MLDFILSTEFIGVYLAFIVGVTLFGIVKLRAGSRLFEAMVSEFARWSPLEQSAESFESYKASVFEFARQSSLKTCGMWSSFLEEVRFAADADGRSSPECSSESIDKLRDNLLFSYATSHRVSRLNPSVISGIGFIGTLLSICAGTLAAEPFLSGEGQFEQALSALLAGGGLAFLSAVVGILGSLSFSLFERSQMEQAEGLVDGLLSRLRQQIGFKTEKHYLSEIRDQMVVSSTSVRQIVQDIGDRVVELKQNQLSAGVVEDTSRELARELTASFEQMSGRLVDVIADTHERAQEQREQQTAAFQAVADGQASLVESQKEQTAAITSHTEGFSKHFEDMAGWQAQTLEALRVQIDWSEKQHDVLERVEGELQLSSGRDERILHTLEEISRGIENLDEAFEEDTDHLIEQTRETQTALMHYLNDTLEMQLSGITDLLKTSQEHAESTAAQQSTHAAQTEAVIEGLRSAVESQTESEREYLDGIRNALDSGIQTLKGAIESSSEDRNQNVARLSEKLEEANRSRLEDRKELRKREEERRQRELERDSRDRQYWERQLQLHEEETEIERRILAEQENSRLAEEKRAEKEALAYKEKFNMLRNGGVEPDLGDENPGELEHGESGVSGWSQAAPRSRADLGRVLTAVRQSRDAIQSALKNFGIVNDQSDYLVKTCQNVSREMNKMNEDLLDQTEVRLNRYGKAYQPLAESNLMICELLTRSIKDASGVRRAVEVDYGRLHELLRQPADRISSLLQKIESLEESNSLSKTQSDELERWWSNGRAVAAIDSYVKQLKGDMSSSARLHLQAQETACELQKRVDTLKQLVEINVLDQVTNWPSVLDEARSAREASRKLAALQKKLSTTAKRSDDHFVEAIDGISRALDQSETLLMNSESGVV